MSTSGVAAVTVTSSDDRRPQHRPDLGHLGEADDDLLLEGAQARELRPELVRARGEVEELERRRPPRGRRGAARGASAGPEIDTRTPGSGAPASSRTTPVTEPVVWARALEDSSSETREREMRNGRRFHGTPSSKNVEARIIEASLDGILRPSSRMRSSKVSRRRISRGPAVSRRGPRPAGTGSCSWTTSRIRTRRRRGSRRDLPPRPRDAPRRAGSSRPSRRRARRRRRVIARRHPAGTRSIGWTAS